MDLRIIDNILYHYFTATCVRRGMSLRKLTTGVVMVVVVMCAEEEFANVNCQAGDLTYHT